MKRDFWIICLLAGVLAQLLIGCRGCNSQQLLAVVESKQGDVQREAAESLTIWRIAEVGTGFALGDALRTRHASTARLSLLGGGKLQVKQDTVMRFQNRRPVAKKHDFDVETGQVLLEASNEELILETGKGVARISPNGQLLIRRTPEGLQFDVTVGRARFEEDGVEAKSVEAGQSYVVKIGAAVIDRTSDGTPASSADAVSPLGDAEKGINALIRGRGVSQKAANDSAFRQLPEGSTTLSAGTTLQLDASSSVDITQGNGSVSLTGVGRYTLRGDRQGILDVNSGKLTTKGATRIAVPGGIIETEDQSAADIKTLGKNRTQINVLRGQVNLIDGQGSTKVLAGEEATLMTDGATQLQGRSLSFADLTINAGESIVVHDAKPPSAVRIGFAPLCSQGGTVRVAAGKVKQLASGESSAALRFTPGRSEYAVRCLGASGDAVVAHGTITVVRDSGARPMPVSAPATAISVDGRSYTVLYQNQLPALTVSWPNAPAASSFTLHLESATGKKTLQTSGPSYMFRSGALLEGHHTLYFEGENRVSRRTGIDITFDNVSPTASLSAALPSDSEHEMTISGVALPGWQVEIGGNKIEQDSQQRFSQKVQVPEGNTAVAVKLIHPTRGTHVYVRRASKAHD